MSSRSALASIRGGTAVHAERQRCERVSEQPAFHLGEWQDANDFAAALGDEVVGTVTKTSSMISRHPMR